MLRKIFAFVLILMMIALPMQAVKAVPKEEYTYKVVIYAGNQGAFSGDSLYERKDIYYGQGITIDLNELGLTLTNGDK